MIWRYPANGVAMTGVSAACNDNEFTFSNPPARARMNGIKQVIAIYTTA